ncbi:MAG: hypothetical protein H7A23_09975 [Leptospiraceae bacterium]|nr:hypothetical protein [Leptospiraceae bacterium]
MSTTYSNNNEEFDLLMITEFAKLNGVVTKVDAESVHILYVNEKDERHYLFKQKPLVKVLTSITEGVIQSIEEEKITIEDDEKQIVEYNLLEFEREFIPLVKQGDSINIGQTIAGQRVYGEIVDDKGNVLQKGTKIGLCA